MYGNCWVVAWTTDRAPGERTQSHLQAQVKAIRLSDWKGWSLAMGSPVRGAGAAPCRLLLILAASGMFQWPQAGPSLPVMPAAPLGKEVLKQGKMLHICKDCGEKSAKRSPWGWGAVGLGAGTAWQPPRDPTRGGGYLLHLQGAEESVWSHLHFQFPLPLEGVREDLGMKPSLGKEGGGKEFYFLSLLLTILL